MRTGPATSAAASGTYARPWAVGSYFRRRGLRPGALAVERCNGPPSGRDHALPLDGRRAVCGAGTAWEELDAAIQWAL